MKSSGPVVPPSPYKEGSPRALLSFALERLGLLGLARLTVRLPRLVRHGLRSVGWLASAAQNAPVSADGRPIPWFPYPAIHFLADRLPHHAHVFEWGAGHSTLWFAQRVATVTSVESDPGWAAYLQRRSPQNVTIIVATDENSYVQSITHAGGAVRSGCRGRAEKFALPMRTCGA